MSELLDLTAALARLMRADNILLLCHKNPDGDTLGSASALYHALKGVGKTAAVLCADPIPSKYQYLKLGLFDGSFEPQYIVAVDVAGVQLFGDTLGSYADRVDLCIDHHPSNSGYADAMLLRADAAATSEILYDLITAMNVTLTPLIAECLYTGISTDTGCFRFANTTAYTHIVAARLIEAGADVACLNRLLFESKTRSQLAIERMAMENMGFYFDNRCAVVCLSREQIAQTGAEPTDIEGITGMTRAIEGVDVGVTLRQLPTGSYKVSLRTVSGIDASAICRRFGGGGHKQAAGCEILGSAENAREAILSEVEKALCRESS